MNSQTGGGQAMSGGKKRKKSLGIFSTLGNFVGTVGSFFGAREENSTMRPLTKGEWQRTMIERMAELYKVCPTLKVDLQSCKNNKPIHCVHVAVVN